MSEQTLFPLDKPEGECRGGEFNTENTHRFSLYRIWDADKPLVMFIGLNPSTANNHKDDPTIQSVRRISKHNGFGGFFMMNLFTYISSEPEELKKNMDIALLLADFSLDVIKDKCADVVFAWGAFKQAKDRQHEVISRFPGALCIGKNNDGSPKHPLF